MNKHSKNFVKIFCIILAFIFVILLTACGDKDIAGEVNDDKNGEEFPSDDEYYIVDIEKIKDPDKVNYNAGEYFDPTGMILKIIWNDGYEQEVRDGQNCTIYPTGPVSEKTEAVTITYDTLTFSFPINVIGIKGIMVTSLPARTLYVEGEAFSPVGMSIATIMKDDSIGNTITNFTLSENAAKLSLSDKSVTVSYEYNSDTFTTEVPVSVVAASSVKIIEAESGIIKDGEKVTSSSLLQYASGNSFVRNLSKGGTITLNIKALKDTTASLRFVASSYEDDPDGGAFAIPLQINQIIDITFNGVPVEISDNEILPGGYDDERGYLSRYCHWYEVAMDDVELHEGDNTLVITSKVDMTMTDDPLTPDVDESDRHSVLFDCLRVFYANPDAIPIKPIDFDITGGEAVSVEAESLEKFGIIRVPEEGPSGVAGNFSGGGFIKNFSENSTITFTVLAVENSRATIKMKGISTSQDNAIIASDFIAGIQINGVSQKFADGIVYDKQPSTGWAASGHTDYIFGEYDLSEGENTVVITFKQSEGAFVDYFTVEPVKA